MRGPVLWGAQVLRLQAGVPEGWSISAALSADEEQLRVHQEEDFPSHTPAGIDVLVMCKNKDQDSLRRGCEEVAAE